MRSHRWLRPLLFLSLILLVVGCTPPTIRSGPSDASADLGTPTAHLAVFDVGQGLSVGFVTADGASLLFDAGPRKDAVHNEILPFFRRHGVEQIDYVVTSHPDQDHIGALVELLRSIPVGTYLDPVIETTNQTYLRALQIIEERGIPAKRVRRGERFPLGEDTQVEVLWPVSPLRTDSDGTVETNNNSVVLLIQHGQVRFLLTGDAEGPAEAAMLEANPDALRADILQVAHHGSRTSSSESFLAAVGASVAIIPVGPDNQYGHPHPETMQALRAAKLTIYRTDVDGTVVVHTDGTSYRVETQGKTP